MSESSGTESTQVRIALMLQEELRSVLTTHMINRLANQVVELIPEPQELPTWEQTQELINLAYGLGWRDRDQAVWKLGPPPTVTIEHTPGKGIVFLYDGKPRP